MNNSQTIFETKNEVRRITLGTETSHVPEEKKSYEIPLVVASEQGNSPNRASHCEATVNN